MAITKIHPIKTTLDLSIDYICDPSKTDEEILITAYKCGHKTAALQFKNTKELMNSSSKNLGRHLIQSFMPDEVSPALAHQIGEELCENHLKGKYEYVITTHIDRGHIHNHIIFNNVSFIDGKAYISNKKSYHQIRKQSDEICQTHGLSIIESTPSNTKTNKVKGQSYKEYTERKKGNSYKAKLQYSIDLAIKKAQDYEEFQRIMRSLGYTIKNGKHISFKANGQERFTRSKTIGSGYTEERIKERIANRAISTNTKSYKRRSSNKVVDINTNNLANESRGFTRWLKLQNLKKMAKSWQLLSSENLTDLNSFNDIVIKIHDEYNQNLSYVKSIETNLFSIADYKKQLNIYNKYKDIHQSYTTASDFETFFQENESKLILFLAADEYLKSNALSTTTTLKELNTQTDVLLNNLEKSKKVLSQHKEKLNDINELKHNLETYLKDHQVSKPLLE